MKTLAFALLVAFASSAVADTIKIQGNASKPFTLSAPGITIKRGDSWDVTISPANTYKDVDVLMAVVVLLRDKI
jgi:hypothetical protein